MAHQWYVVLKQVNPETYEVIGMARADDERSAAQSVAHRFGLVGDEMILWAIAQGRFPRRVKNWEQFSPDYLRELPPELPTVSESKSPAVPNADGWFESLEQERQKNRRIPPPGHPLRPLTGEQYKLF